MLGIQFNTNPLMSDVIVLRVFSKSGRSRVEISQSSTLAALKQEIETRLNVASKTQQLFLDDKLTKKLIGKDTDKLTQLKLKNGDIIHVGNQNTQMVASQPNSVNSGIEQIDTQPKQIFNASGKVAKQEPPAPSSPSLTKSKSKTQPLTDEEVKRSHCTHGPNGKCVNCLGVSKEAAASVKYQCAHPPGQKCVNCTTESQQQIVKHESFEHYLSEMKAKCKNSHRPEQRCQNCAPAQNFSYKVDYNCPNHKRYPEGMCNKCLPPAVVLKRQTYRHVDYVSFMQFPEMADFVGHWQQSGCMEQRLGHLYGYYSEDPNYPEGVRVNIEALYEPPQIGEINGVQELEDPNRVRIDMVAEALGLERVGWIFTSIDSTVFLSTHEVRKISSLQEQYVVDHPEGYKVSKFVTVVVKPKGDGAETGVECYMVSDQCQSLERDDIFGHSESRKKMVLREGGPNEMIPSVIKEGKPSKEFEPDFFIVSLAHGQPRKHDHDFNVLKNYDFLINNRAKKLGRNDLKDYLKRHSKKEPSKRRFANFHLLVYIAQIMDSHTAQAIASQVAEEKDLDPALVELLESL